jgi:hypothetical protein
MWYICKVEYYLAIKRNGIAIDATRWMNFENIQSKTRQSQKAKITLFQLM